MGWGTPVFLGVCVNLRLYLRAEIAFNELTGGSSNALKYKSLRLLQLPSADTMWHSPKF